MPRVASLSLSVVFEEEDEDEIAASGSVGESPPMKASVGEGASTFLLPLSAVDVKPSPSPLSSNANSLSFNPLKSSDRSPTPPSPPIPSPAPLSVPAGKPRAMSKSGASKSNKSSSPSPSSPSPPSPPPPPILSLLSWELRRFKALKGASSPPFPSEDPLYRDSDSPIVPFSLVPFSLDAEAADDFFLRFRGFLDLLSEARLVPPRPFPLPLPRPRVLFPFPFAFRPFLGLSELSLSPSSSSEVAFFFFFRLVFFFGGGPSILSLLSCEFSRRPAPLAFTSIFSNLSSTLSRYSSGDFASRYAFCSNFLAMRRIESFLSLELEFGTHSNNFSLNRLS